MPWSMRGCGWCKVGTGKDGEHGVTISESMY